MEPILVAAGILLVLAVLWWLSARSRPVSASRHYYPASVPEPEPLQDTQFSVYRPRELVAGTWATLVVFAHPGEPFADPARGPVDPLQEVESRARALMDSPAAPPHRVDARRALPFGARLRIAVELDGVTCNPPAAEFDRLEAVHEATFRLLASPASAGTTARGYVRVWCGPLVIAEATIAVPVVAAAPPVRSAAAPLRTFAAAAPVAAGPEATREPMRRYRKIFPSYAHADAAVVKRVETAARTLGDQYLQDVLTLRSGEDFDTRLLELIEEADVFQLFWSTASMRSAYCRREWEHAVSLDRDTFVRPVYWERPMPEDAAADLPPAELRRLHFARLDAEAVTPPYQLAGPGRPPRPGHRLPTTAKPLPPARRMSHRVSWVPIVVAAIVLSAAAALLVRLL